jgi:hypothetical protein
METVPFCSRTGIRVKSDGAKKLIPTTAPGIAGLLQQDSQSRRLNPRNYAKPPINPSGFRSADWKAK